MKGDVPQEYLKQFMEEQEKEQKAAEAKKKPKKSGKKQQQQQEPEEEVKLSREEMKSLRKQRKVVRKDLKSQGLKSLSDFELFAEDVGLKYPKGSGAAFWVKLATRTEGRLKLIGASIGVTRLLITAAAILAGVFLIAYMSEEKGHFTINLTADMLREGFILSETADMKDQETRLFAKEIENSNATSVYEMSRKIGEVDGDHNGPGYLAYTFYLKNAGEMTTDYGYTVNILSESLNTASAVWLMFFEDDKQIIYAQAQPNGKPEELYGYPSAPYIESAYYPDDQYYQEDGVWGIKTTPFIDENTALQGYVEEFAPGDVKKYTVVVWLEGDDPDCNNSILGGHVGFNIQFERLGEDETGYFKGLFREEYDQSYNAENPLDAGHVTDNSYQAHSPSVAPDAESADTKEDENTETAAE